MAMAVHFLVDPIIQDRVSSGYASADGKKSMNIGVPAEAGAGETRVAATPETVKKLVAGKHAVLVQSGAGAGASIPDADFQAAGASIAAGAADVYARAELILKARPPQSADLGMPSPAQGPAGRPNLFAAG